MLEDVILQKAVQNVIATVPEFIGRGWENPYRVLNCVQTEPNKNYSYYRASLNLGHSQMQRAKDMLITHTSMMNDSVLGWTLNEGMIIAWAEREINRTAPVDPYVRDVSDQPAIPEFPSLRNVNLITQSFDDDDLMLFRNSIQLVILSKLIQEGKVDWNDAFGKICSNFGTDRFTTVEDLLIEIYHKAQKKCRYEFIFMWVATQLANRRFQYLANICSITLGDIPLENLMDDMIDEWLD